MNDTTTMRGILAPEHRQAYITGGRATITILNPTTGVRFTYKITLAESEKMLFVKVLTGEQNDSDLSYRYIGILDNHFNFRLTKGSKIAADAPSVKAFAFLASHIQDTRIEVWHEGSCCRCGRKLTVPESIAAGIGPTCQEAAA